MTDVPKRKRHLPALKERKAKHGHYSLVRHRALEEKLRLSEVRYRTMIEQSPLSTQIFAPSGVSLYANAAWERLWGISHTKLVEVGYNILRDKQLVKLGIMPHIKRAFRGEFVTIPAVRYEPPKTVPIPGFVPYRWVKAFMYPITYDDTPREIVLIHDDITEEKKVEAELKEGERRKDMFIGMASHELKTPITSLKMFTHLLGQSIVDPGALRVLGRMDDQIDRLSKLVANLLDLSRMQSGKLSFDIRPFDLDELVRETVENVRLLAVGHPLSVSGTIGVLAKGDRDRIGQVLINLITNAVKYSTAGTSIEIDLSCDTACARVAVTDHGIGIKDEYRRKIFDRFYQVPDQKAMTYPGLGIGLYISAIFIERHGGTIDVTSSPGKGSTFAFTIPLAIKEKS